MTTEEPLQIPVVLIDFDGNEAWRGMAEQTPYGWEPVDFPVNDFPENMNYITVLMREVPPNPIRWTWIDLREQ